MNDLVTCCKVYPWDSLSPAGSEEDEGSFSREIKTEFHMDDDLFGINKSPDELIFSSKAKSVPTASSGVAAVSLQTAFCKKPSQKMPPEVSFNSNSNDNIKSEIGDGTFGGFAQFDQLSSIEPTNNTQDSTVQSCQNGNNCADAQQMDIYRDLILRHLIQDISTTCAKLGLPTDPFNWTAEHGSRWISEMCQQFNLTPPRQMFLTGRALLSMNQKDFEALAPEGGDTLYAQLQLWKTAFESYHHQQCGQSSGMTAADNTVPKNNWTSTQSMVCNEPIKNPVRLDFPQQFNLSPGEIHNVTYYSNPNVSNSSQDTHSFFSSGVMPSPSDSDRSSNASIHDMNEDDCLEMQLNMLQMRPGNMQFGQEHMMRGHINNIGMTTLPNDDQRPSPFPRHSGTVHLWHFIRELLDHPKQYGSCVRWVDREEGTFKIESSHHLARFWGQRKNRTQMNYDKLSRSLRQYYKKGIIQKPEKKQRLVYKFLPPYNL